MTGNPEELMHIALYREFRPVTFDELIGQDHIVRILKNQIKTGNTSHAYLFSGTRGTGKTTTARILAKALNCRGEGEKPCGQCEPCRSFAGGSFVDVIEMDAASHRGVSDIHEITDSVMYAPAAGKYKVYIIDEVHMLSNEAFNALLKTLEEPPEHVVFILATTEPQKVPATILSRCMKLDFRRVSEKQLVENMSRICAQKRIEAEQSALSLIAVSADGSVRDSLSILEQCICPGEPLRRDDVASVLGTAGVEPLLKLTGKVLAQDTSGALLCLNDILSAGAETRQFMKEWLEHFRNLLIAKYVQDPSNILNMSRENVKRVSDQSAQISQQMLDNAVRELTETISLTKWAKHPRVMLEMAIVKLSAPAGTERISPEKSRASEKRDQIAQAQLPAGQNVPEEIPDHRNTPVSALPNEREQEPPADFQSGPEVLEPLYDEGMTPLNPAFYDYSDERFPLLDELQDQLEQAFPDQQLNSRDEAEPPAGNNQPEPSREHDRVHPPAFSDDDWYQAIDQAASVKGILTRLIGRTHFRSEQDGKLYITCDDSTTAELLRSRGKEAVEQILQQITGRSLNIIAEIQDDSLESRSSMTEEQQAHLNQFFGREVPVI